MPGTACGARCEGDSGKSQTSAVVKIDICEFSIVIVAQSNNPTILNPDFLHQNGIVGSNWRVDEAVPPLTTPVMSQIAFKGGLLVRADPANVSFAISGPEETTTALDVTVCVDAAKGYLKTVPHVPYTALGLNPKAIDRNPPSSRVSNALRSEGTWMSFQSIRPRLELKATYEYSDRKTTLEVVEEQRRTVYRANIHRDVAEPNQQMRVSSMLATLNAWQTDLADFRALVENSIPRSSG